MGLFDSETNEGQLKSSGIDLPVVKHKLLALKLAQGMRLMELAFDPGCVVSEQALTIFVVSREVRGNIGRPKWFCRTSTVVAP